MCISSSIFTRNFMMIFGSGCVVVVAINGGKTRDNKNLPNLLEWTCFLFDFFSA